MEMEMEMEMRAREDVGMGQDLTPPVPPLAFSLYDSSLLSHCSTCFSPLLPTFPPNPHHLPSLFYCSPRCSAADCTAERHLLLCPDLPPCYTGDTSDLRAALRLLHLFQTLGLPLAGDRIGGLLTNREKLISRVNSDGSGDEIIARIREGGKAMAVASSVRDGVEFSGESVLEEAVLCIVLTNAVEVQGAGGRAIGIAVYDTSFSWINHSCSPNACYRFLTHSPEMETQQLSCELKLRIIPGGQGIENAVCSYGGLGKGSKGYGPRIVVRSIKAIKKGEEVTIAYTDLLQPKAVRQSELWLKYRFACCCRRCSALPLTFVDNVLQDTAAAYLDHAHLSSDHNFYRDEATRKLADYIDDTITEYLSAGEPESCCERLQKILIRGTLDEHLDLKEGKVQLNIRLHPFHHLSLNAYTTLASAYKIRAGHLLALHPAKNGHQLEAFNMSRTSAAYSLLLAGATHHLFLSESSLIASAANFWTNAGESLLGLARSSLWNLLVKQDSSLPSHNCCNCSLVDKFGTNLVLSQSENADFEDISRHFLACITKITPEVWSFLIFGCHYLELLKDPTDFSWLGKTANNWNSGSCSGGRTDDSVSRCEPHGCSIQQRANIFKLGIHCLLYGGYLLRICYDGHSYWTCYIQKHLGGEESLSE